jgi:hypothetical protein
LMGSGTAELAQELASTAGRWRGGEVGGGGSWSRVGRRAGGEQAI